MHCELCESSGGNVVWQDARLRVIDVADNVTPAYLRVIWQVHVRELTDLSPDDRRHFLQAVCAIETAIRSAAQPDKCNIALFGNVVDHLHAHVMGRWRSDSHFPNPLWGARMRDGAVPAVDRVLLRQAVATALDAMPA